jgi:hypothetical protein
VKSLAAAAKAKAPAKTALAVAVSPKQVAVAKAASKPAAVVTLGRAAPPAGVYEAAAGKLKPTTTAKTTAATAPAAAKSAAASSAGAITASAQPAPPAKTSELVAGDQAVTVDIMSSDSGYSNKIFWTSDNWSTRNYLGVDNQTASVNLGSFAAGTKIEFGIQNDHGEFYKTGSADQNADNFQHARVEGYGAGVKIGFEDLRGGGDADFNDAIISVQGLSKAVVATAPVGSPPATPIATAAPIVGAISTPGAKTSTNKPAPKSNRSGLGDGTNPGSGAGRVNSPNVGTENPNQKSTSVAKSAASAANQTASAATVKAPVAAKAPVKSSASSTVRKS